MKLKLIKKDRSLKSFKSIMGINSEEKNPSVILCFRTKKNWLAKIINAVIDRIAKKFLMILVVKNL